MTLSVDCYRFEECGEQVLCCMGLSVLCCEEKKKGLLCSVENGFLS